MAKSYSRQPPAGLTDPLLTALTVMLAVIMFVAAPLQAAGVFGAHEFGFAIGVVIIATAVIVSNSWLAVAPLFVSFALIALATLLRLRHPWIGNIYLDVSAWLILSLTLVVVTFRAVFAAGRVTYHRVIGAILLYLAIGLLFMALFCLVALLEPNSFRGLGQLHDNLAVAGNFIYFSFVTLTTVGYGDVVPLHPVARSLANIEAIVGQLYPATLLARLVSLEIGNRRTMQSPGSGEFIDPVH
jgi:hypothetical protein